MMKTYVCFFLLISLILFINCYEIESVDQAYSAEPNSTVDVPIIVSIWEETQNIRPSFGVRLPHGWSVQEPIELSGAVKRTLHYSPELSDSMQAIDPAAPGYYWWMSGSESGTVQEGNCSFTVRLKTDDKIGAFFIDYAIANGCENAGARSRSNGHPLLVGIARAEADLYISPAGDDKSSGLSFADPVKTITTAFAKIVADSLHPHTIHLANGVYSPTSGEYLPLKVPNYVSVVGESKEGVILDGEHQNSLFLFDHKKTGTLENLTIKNANVPIAPSIHHGSAVDCYSSTVSLKNILICNNEAGGIYCDDSEIFLKNTSLIENTAGVGAGIRCKNSTLTCENTIISKNKASNSGGGFYFLGTVRVNADNLLLSENSAPNGGSIYCTSSNAFLKNVVIKNSTARKCGGGIHGAMSTITMNGVRVENNSALYKGGGIFCTGAGALNLKNSTLRFNEAGNSGGGIYKTALPTVKFDSLARSNIYQNQAAVKGSDLYNGGGYMNVVVDTFTTLSPAATHAYPLSKFTFDILHQAKKNTNVDDVTHFPKSFALRQNYPNPFNPNTTIEYDVPTAAHVRLAIFDILGRRTRILVDKQEQAGRFHISWEGYDERGMPVAGGLYFCRMQAGEFSTVIKMVLVR
jgi:predicted outer membrane repeat protein